MLHFNPAELRPVIEEAFANQCELLLVKDWGIYLMAAEGERREDGRIKHLVYADHCHPGKDEDGYDAVRQLAGGDDFGEELTFTAEMFERILSAEQQLWIHLTEDEVRVHVAPVNWVRVAEYRQCAARMLYQVEVTFNACQGTRELAAWRASALTILTTACHTECKRATPGDRQVFQAAIVQLQQRVDTVNADGALRYPAF